TTRRGGATTRPRAGDGARRARRACGTVPVGGLGTRRNDLDAVELAPTGGARGVLAAAEAVATVRSARRAPTLRAALGLQPVAAVLR
ncbi:hypothetical protein, partial [Nocardia aobensis]|uniref:hypothetical protein n=1 Tax=Nocardia aobensis TaxID=257277 RepID=UPI001C3F46FD